jgi:hypothetical protein
MGKKLNQAVNLLKRTSKGTYTLAAILSFLADLLVRFAIPGSGLFEILIALAVAAGVFVITLIRETQDSGLIQSIHSNYAASC